MKTLFDKVLVWGEKLIYQGTRDDTLPPDVLKALTEVGYNGWATAEVRGGGRKELQDIAERMKRVLQQ